MSFLAEKFLTLIIFTRFKRIELIHGESPFTTTIDAIELMENRMGMQLNGTLFKRLLNLNTRLYHPLKLSDQKFLEEFQKSANVGMLMEDRAGNMEAIGLFPSSNICPR